MADVSRQHNPSLLALLVALSFGTAACEQILRDILTSEREVEVVNPHHLPSPTPTPAPAPAPAPREPVPCSPGRATTVFDFSLPARSSEGMGVGPVRAGDGPLSVTLDFPGDFTILVCVGSVGGGCWPMGGHLQGHPMTGTFDIPADLPAGLIAGDVYFNTAYPQPPGDAKGTVRFEYNCAG
jgi:hypothetical protein